MTKPTQRGKTAATGRSTARTTPGVTAKKEPARPSVRRVRRRDVDEMPDQPFAEGAQDAMDPDLRYRLVSEAAYRRYVERGYEDGHDLEDWLLAEAEVDHVVVNRGPRQEPGGAG